MRLYNTLTRSEETFEPSEDKIVRMYACGLTVYARGHIGNFRTFVCLDVLVEGGRGLDVTDIVASTKEVGPYTCISEAVLVVPLRRCRTAWTFTARSEYGGTTVRATPQTTSTRGRAGE